MNYSKVTKVTKKRAYLLHTFFNSIYIDSIDIKICIYPIYFLLLMLPNY